MLCVFLLYLFRCFCKDLPPIPRAVFRDDSSLFEMPIEINDDSNSLKREAIKEAFRYSWWAYRNNTWGADELKPISKTANNWMGGLYLPHSESLFTI